MPVAPLNVIVIPIGEVGGGGNIGIVKEAARGLEPGVTALPATALTLYS